MKKKLELEFLRAQLNYDPETGVFLWAASTNRRIKCGSVAGTIMQGYIYIGIGGQQIKAHRLAWFYHYGYWPESSLDHINGDKTDNRICNLRLATTAQNAQNMRTPPKHNKSGLLGAYWNKRQKCWTAQIQVNNRSKHLGNFNSAEEAHLAYLAAKREMHEFCTI